MKHLKLFFALFAMLALGVGNAWGAEETVVYTETFEDSAYKTSTTYNNSTEKKHGPTNTQWGVLCGTPNTGAHNGSKAFAMRYYKSVNKTPTLTQYFDINNVDAISFWSKTESTNNKLNVEYSTDGGSSWSSLASNISITTAYKEYSYNFSTQQAKVRLRFTMGTTTEKKSMIIDDIEFISTSSTGSGTEEPVLSVEPNKVDFGTKNIYFESEKQGSLEIEITGQNLTGNVTAALSGIDATVFDLSQESFTPEDGEVSEKLTVSYEVSEEKEYSATLTLSSDGVDNVELPITLTTINKKPTVYTKVTDAATLSAGDKVIFVYEAGKVAAGKLSSGYLTSIDIAQAINTTANPATVSITDEAVIEYTLGGTTGAWEFISASGKLSEASANSTKSVDLAYNKGTTWTIAISSGNATIKGTTNTIQYNEVNPRFKTYTSGQKTIQLYAISVPKYAVNFAQPEGGELIVKNGENAIVSGNTFAEGIKLTVTANPANGYEGGTVVVKDAVDNDVTATVYADGVLTMPAYAVTISATFEKKECTLLATPTVSATTTYSSATLTWDAVTNAAKYSVKVGAADAIETTETSYEVTGLNAETEYTYQVQAIAEAGQDTYCDSEVAEGTFTTATAPVATVTLSDVDGEQTLTGSLYGTITLPKTAAECSKTFVGWDADENCDHAPTYAPGAEYTFTTQYPTLYAVYADGEGGGSFTITKTMSEIVAENEYTVSEGTNVTCYTSLTLDENITLSTTGEANCGSFWKDPREWRLYQNKSGNAIVTASDGCSLTSVKFTFSVDKTGTLLNAGVAMQSGIAVSASDKSATYTVGNSKNDVTNGQVKITAIEVSYSKEGEYSNYSTTCAAALEKPTFSVEEGTYTEAKSIELSATEGNIYYTLDGTDPTESSTQYITAIALNECGTTTIKAIAIGAGSQSPIASATYTINLPIPANSASDPYTSDEAKDVYASGCYNDEWVYVTGTVQTAQYYSSSGSYTITLTDGFQFYYFFKDDQQTKFADGEIETGDVLVACGQLSEHNGNCQLAKNCYLVSIEEYTDPKTDISNTIDNPYTVTQADELIDDITSDLTKTVFVKGVVTGFATNKVTIRDTREGTEYIELYKHTLATGITPLSQGDLIIATGTMAKYNGTTYQMNEGCQVVWKKAAATIEIANVSLEVGKTHTIAATIAPAEAASAVTYTIKSGSEYISLSGNVITANEVGTATITATIETAADYMGNSVDFTVTVGPKTESEEVVILAEYNGQWYALKAETGSSTNSLAALEVEYFNGVLYNVDEADKASITWKRTIVGNFETFQYGDKYLKGSSSTNLFMEDGTGGKYQWDKDTHTMLIGSTNRTFLYQGTYFKNYAISNAGRTVDGTTYSALPVVTAPVYATGNPVYTRTVTNGNYGTICIPYASTSYSGAEFYEVSWLNAETGLYLDQLEAGAQLEVGKPYIFRATSTEIKVTCTGDAKAAPVAGANGLTGTFTEIAANTDLIGNYIIAQNQIWVANDQNTLPANRAYINATLVPKTEQPKLAGRRRVCMGENAETGVDNIITTGAPVKVIENGQLIIIRNGEKFNVQGQKL